MSKIGITGTIASGKTMVSVYLKSKGFYVFDCDEYNSYLLEEGNEGYNFVKSCFPETIINNKLNRKKLASIVFSDTKQKEKLESFLHPLIISKLIEESDKYDLFFAEVPLLFEKDLKHLFDKVWLLVSDDDTCINRLIEKGYTRTEAIERINSQFSIDIKKKMSDEILYNNSDFEHLYAQIDWLLKDVR